MPIEFKISSNKLFLLANQLLKDYKNDVDSLTLSFGNDGDISLCRGKVPYNDFIEFEHHPITELLFKREITKKIKVNTLVEKNRLRGEYIAKFSDGTPAISIKGNRIFFNFNILEAIYNELMENSVQKDVTYKKILMTKIYWAFPKVFRRQVRKAYRKRKTHLRPPPMFFIGTTANILIYLLEKMIEELTGKTRVYRPTCIISHDVDLNYCQTKGVDILFDIEKKNHVSSTWFFTPHHKDFPLNCKRVKYLFNNGFEIGVHGYTHDGLLDKISPDKRKKRLKFALKELSACKIETFGFRSPWMLRTNDLWQLIDNIGYIYDSSYPDKDTLSLTGLPGVNFNRPFHPIINVQNCWRQLNLIEFPVSYPQDVQILEDYNLEDSEAFAYWKTKIDFIKDFHGFFIWHTHPIQINSRLKLFQKTIDYLKREKFFFSSFKDESLALLKTKKEETT